MTRLETDKQKMFNTVVSALAKQGTQARSELPGGNKGMCLYRGPNNTKCAAGHLIPNDRYDAAMEGTGSINTVIEKFNLEEWADGLTVRFLRDIQKVHDDEGGLSHGWVLPWHGGIAAAFVRVAEDWELDASIVEASWPKL